MYFLAKGQRNLQVCIRNYANVICAQCSSSHYPVGTTSDFALNLWASSNCALQEICNLSEVVNPGRRSQNLYFANFKRVDVARVQTRGTASRKHLTNESRKKRKSKQKQGKNERRMKESYVARRGRCLREPELLGAPRTGPARLW